MQAQTHTEKYISEIQKQFDSLFDLNFGTMTSGPNSIDEIFALIEQSRNKYRTLIKDKTKFEDATYAVWAYAGLVYYLEYLEKRKKAIENS